MERAVHKTSGVGGEDRRMDTLEKFKELGEKATE